MTERGLFNFRHVADRVGIALESNEVSWALGHVIRTTAARLGHEPERLLTEKTDPNPSVRAEHCIAHYPVRIFPEVCDAVRSWWGDRSRQADLFDSAEENPR